MLQFKDLNRNGKLDPYEDWRLAAGVRAQDLLQQMTLEEMAGVMVHGTLSNQGGSTGSVATGYDEKRISSFIVESHVNAFISPPMHSSGRIRIDKSAGGRAFRSDVPGGDLMPAPFQIPQQNDTEITVDSRYRPEGDN